MVQSTMDSGKEIRQTDMALSFMLMEISMRGSGSMTKPMDMVLTSMQMVPHMSVNGMKINNTVKVSRNGQMVPNMKAPIRMARKTVTDASHLPMEVLTLVNSKIMRSLDLENTYGLMANSMRAAGKRIKCTVKAL
jgi:hypothetical protein